MLVRVSRPRSTRQLSGLFFQSPPPRGGTGFSNQQTGCHLIGVCRVPRTGLKAWLGVHITFVSGLFVVVAASTGVLSMAPWIVWGLSEVPAIEKKVCPPTMGGEPPRAIKYPAVIGLDGLRAPVTVVELPTHTNHHTTTHIPHEPQ